MSQRRLVILATVVAAALVVGLVAFRALTRKEAPTSISQFQGGAEVASAFAGIPQDGTVLGDPAAPVTIDEYVDLKCPHCADAAENVVPTLVTAYVRPGRVRLRLRPLAFLAADSRSGAWAASAAARQGKMWQFADVVLRNQGDEAARWLTPTYIAHAAEVAGVDPRRLERDMARPAVRARLLADQREAELVEARTTPFWVVRGPGGVCTVSGAQIDPLLAAIGEVSPAG